eukprot:m.26504 g.26504  ORF g.26504 m.26504 type:complete len:160 (+) comp8834_c0_seq1:408-887(+)
MFWMFWRRVVSGVIFKRHRFQARSQFVPLLPIHCRSHPLPLLSTTVGVPASHFRFLSHTTRPLNMPMVGGISEARAADEEVKAIAADVRAAAEAQIGAQAQWEAVSVASQVVAGTMFFIKVNTGSGFAHIKVFRSLPPFTNEFKAAQTGKAEADPIEFF